MSDEQTAGPTQYPATPEGDYRKAADALREQLDTAPGSFANAGYRMGLAKSLAEIAIRMIAAQHGAGIADVPPSASKQ